MRVLTILIILAGGVTVFSGETIKNQIEVGEVQWGRDLDAALENKDRIWTASGVASRIIDALKAVNRSVPEYLKALAKAEH